MADLIKPKIHSPHGPAIPQVGIYPSPQDLNKTIYMVLFSNSPKVETIQMSINRNRRDEQTMAE